MLVLSCDPGIDGALALLCSRQGLLDCADLPACPNGISTGRMTRWLDVAALRLQLQTWSLRHRFVHEAVHAVIERPIAMPNLPAQTIASQFDTFGVLRATLPRFAQDLAVVNPKEWKAIYGLGNDKDDARATCAALYPTAPVVRKKDHNRADSVLIGHWLMRKLNGAPAPDSRETPASTEKEPEHA